MLSNLAVFNRGILFLDECDEYGKILLPLLTEGTIKHLVRQRATSYYVKGLRKYLIEYCYMTEAATLTVCNVKWRLRRWLRVISLPEAWWGNGLFSESAKYLTRIAFVNCTFEVCVARFPYRTFQEGKILRDESWEWSYSFKAPVKTVSKDFRAAMQHELERRTCHLDRGEFYSWGQGGARDYDVRWSDVEDEVYHHSFLEWCLDSKHTARALLWPCPQPEKQLQWLKTSLDTLDQDTRQSLSEAFASYNTHWREYTVYLPIERGPFDVTSSPVFKQQILPPANKNWQMEEDIYWQGRKLDLLDCAFLAALLKITPRVSKSPYPIVNHLKPMRKGVHMSCSWFENSSSDEEESDS